MKKVLCLLISLVLFIPVNIYGKNVDLSEINLTIDFNDDWYVFTRYNLDGNKDLETLGVTKDYMENFFNENEAYIDASPKELGTDFILRIKPVEDMNNLSNYPDDVVKEVAKDSASSDDAINKLNKTIEKNENDRHKDIITCKFPFNDKPLKYYAEELSTSQSIESMTYGEISKKYGAEPIFGIVRKEEFEK